MIYKKPPLYLLIALCIGLIFCSCKNYESKFPIPENEQRVNAFVGRGAELLCKKYGGNCAGTLISMPGGPLRGFGYDFQIQGPLSQHELRILLIKMSQDLLNLVNNDESLRPYLKHYPFTHKNIYIGLFLRDKRGRDITPPEIGTADLHDGILTFEQITDERIPVIVHKDSETYEEALQKIANFKTAQDNNNAP